MKSNMTSVRVVITLLCYMWLKAALKKKGHIFHSQTDTEVLIHLIEEVQSETKTSLEETVRIALSKVIGAYAIVVMDKNDPDRLN